ncbi:MAG: DUF924 family protein [Legionellales bacterium]|nr:DUF924 family protein [Legionellales bacterium]
MQIHTSHSIDWILDFWFGNSANGQLPDSSRMQLWFADDEAHLSKLRQQLSHQVQAAQEGAYSHWQASARGSLALIILLNVVPKRLYPNQHKAYQSDAMALDICQTGIKHQWDHQLTLIERAFYYTPLLEAEDLTLQRQSVVAYQALMQYSLMETKLFYQTFLALALRHFEIIDQFGRFPERNPALGRQTTVAELAYLRI